MWKTMPQTANEKRKVNFHQVEWQSQCNLSVWWFDVCLLMSISMMDNDDEPRVGHFHSISSPSFARDCWLLRSLGGEGRKKIFRNLLPNICGYFQCNVWVAISSSNKEARVHFFFRSLFQSREHAHEKITQFFFCLFLSKKRKKDIICIKMCINTLAEKQSRDNKFKRWKFFPDNRRSLSRWIALGCFLARSWIESCIESSRARAKTKNPLLSPISRKLFIYLIPRLLSSVWMKKKKWVRDIPIKSLRIQLNVSYCRRVVQFYFFLIFTIFFVCRTEMFMRWKENKKRKFIFFFILQFSIFVKFKLNFMWQ